MIGYGPTIVFKSGIPDLIAVSVDRSVITLGKHPTCDVVLSNPFVSRHHARIEVKGSGAVIRDMGSKNGTFVNGAKIGNEPTELDEGSLLEFGRNQVTAVFHMADSTVTLDNIQSLKPPSDESKISVDGASRQVQINNKIIDPALTKKEFDILQLLYSRMGQVCSHAEIARAGWPERNGVGVEKAEIRQYIRRIRRRLESADSGGNDTDIKTMRSSGYRLVSGQ